MIEREVDVVERVAHLMCDGGGEPADNGRAFRLMELRFEFAQAPKARDHLVEDAGERAHLVGAAGGGHAKIEIAGRDTPRRLRQILNRARETPDEKDCEERGDE